MNKEVEELIEEIKGFGNCGFFTMTTEERDLLLDYINQLETNRDEAIEYIKHSWWLRLDQVYDTSKNLQGWEVEELLSILERGKE